MPNVARNIRLLQLWLIADILNRRATRFQEFKICDKKTILDRFGLHVWESIRDGSAVANPRLLSRFLIFVFADLKIYRFTYWHAMPALIPSVPFRLTEEPRLIAQPLEHQGLLIDLYRELFGNFSSSVETYIHAQTFGMKRLTGTVCILQRSTFSDLSVLSLIAFENKVSKGSEVGCAVHLPTHGRLDTKAAHSL